MRYWIATILLLALASYLLISAFAQDDPVARAKKAERSLHRAVDAWAAAEAEGKPTTQPAADIHESYSVFMRHVRKTHYTPIAVAIVPDDLADAGVVKHGEHEMSYFAGPGQSGVVMGGFERSEWSQDRLPPHGLLCGLGIDPQELRKSFKVTGGDWADEDKRVLRLHYVLDGRPGIIEAVGTKTAGPCSPTGAS